MVWPTLGSRTAKEQNRTRMSLYQKGKTNLDFTEARDSEWQWHQLGHKKVCTSLQTDNHASTSPLSFFTGRMPFLPPNQQRQSTEGTNLLNRYCCNKCTQIQTCDAANCSFSSPVKYLFFSSRMSSRFFASRFLNVSMSSRYDVGVT